MAKNATPTDWIKVRRVAGWSLLVALFFATVGFTDTRMHSVPCSGVEAAVLDTLGHSFIDAAGIQQLVKDKYGDVLEKPVGAINMALLEKIMLNNPFVADARVFSTIDGKLHIEVYQRDPLVRVINFANQSFYIDDEGVFMPMSEKYTARVPVANGYIFTREAERKVQTYTVEELRDTTTAISRVFQVFEVAKYIRQHQFWDAQIEQIYVNVKGEMELIPRVGDHVIVLGDGKDLDEKFEKLYLFYKEGLSKTGWNKYSVINLKYHHQVVCTKK